MELPENLTVGSWDDPSLVEETYDGIERRVLCFDDETMQVHYTVDEGASSPNTATRRPSRLSTSSAAQSNCSATTRLS